MTEAPANLTNEQLQFFHFLRDYSPEFLIYWDWSKSEIMFSAIADRINSASSGEAIYLAFLANVWSHTTKFEFDFLQAIRTLDGSYLEGFKLWVDAPIWP